MKPVGNRGGKRARAGRPCNSGGYREKTEPIRLPISGIPHTKALIEKIWELIPQQQPKKDNLLLLLFNKFTEITIQFLNSEIQSKDPKSKDRQLTSKPNSSSHVIPILGKTLLDRDPLPLDQRPKLYASAIAASFEVTSTAEQGQDSESVDLHEILIQDPATTFLLPVVGDSMNRAGIQDGDLIVVQRVTDEWSQLRNHDIVTALVNGSQTVKRFERVQGRISLVPDSDNPEHQAIEMDDEMDVTIFGIVMYSIHPTHKRYAFH